MVTIKEVLETIDMLSLQHLNIRTVTMGINLLDCVDVNPDRMVEKVKDKIVKKAENFVKIADSVGRRYGIPIVNKRITVSPASLLLTPLIAKRSVEEAMEAGVELARGLDEAAATVGVDFIGGYTALVHKGTTPGDEALIRSIPKAISSTEHVCSSVNIASTKTGINVDAAILMGRIIKDLSKLTKNGIGNAKLVTFANAPEDNPFMAGGFHGIGEPECTINIGISGPGVIRAVVERSDGLDFRELSEAIKRAAFKITRAGELIGREIAKELGVKFGIIDLSLAPAPFPGESVAEIIEGMGISSCGSHGSTLAIALLTDAVKKGGAMASSFVGGLSGAFIPVSEDLGMVEAVKRGSMGLDKLEAMTSVCSSGLDMVAIPGDTPPETVTAIILDEMAIGVFTNKSVGVRIIPVPGAKPGDEVEFGGLFGKTVVMDVKRYDSSKFVLRGGQVPPPITSLRN